MRPRTTILLVSTLVPLLACHKARESAPAADGAPGGAAATAPQDELGVLQQRVAGYRAELESARADQGKGEAASTLPEDAPAARCSRVCDLSASICDLSDRICELAEEHGDESRYVDACSEGRDDCQHATEACNACSS